MTILSKDGNGTYISIVQEGDVSVIVMALYSSKEDAEYVKSELDRILESLVIKEAAHIQITASGEEGMKTVGTEKFGYVTIPDSWGRFRELDGGTDLQYSDVNGDSIITLNVISVEGLTEEQKAMVTTEYAAKNIWYNLEQNDVKGIESAKGRLGEYDAFQLSGTFISEDHSLPSMIMCWIFEDENKVIHYVSAEAPVESALIVIFYVENSYSLIKTGD